MIGTILIFSALYTVCSGVCASIICHMDRMDEYDDDDQAVFVALASIVWPIVMMWFVGAIIGKLLTGAATKGDM